MAFKLPAIGRCVKKLISGPAVIMAGRREQDVVHQCKRSPHLCPHALHASQESRPLLCNVSVDHLRTNRHTVRFENRNSRVNNRLPLTLLLLIGPRRPTGHSALAVRLIDSSRRLRGGASWRWRDGSVTLQDHSDRHRETDAVLPWKQASS